jgi:methionine aminopeptidase
MATDEDSSLSNSDNVTKYQVAADITQRTSCSFIPIFDRVGALAKVIEACVDGASIYDICKLGDDTITEASTKVYSKSKDGKKIHKGTF